MKKVFQYIKRALPLFIISLLTSCEESDEGPERVFFEMTSTTWYRFSPTAPAPAVVNGTNYTSFAYLPGGGTGTATDMGSITTFFNQLAYTSDATVPQPVPVGTLPASVSLIPTLPVLGGPLPLIQAGDFAALTSADAWLQMPATDASGRVINSVIFNGSGDALFTTPTSPSIITPVSATRLNLSGKLAVVGGRGKFANATGELDLTVFFNPTNPNDAGYNVEGWIEY
ncbi:hypothetical protein [Rufibacter latericius]|uniref:Uncharacterized protein n=1 Tax=Rufibacter latericius TaxID=2487040 RepID=A0A3M9MU45_9BACT|nr:hypothetical protein [Rufibacter latericius]RNI29026.1 hypothetical protein EFB08_06230 [Rufibacter latericius]